MIPHSVRDAQLANKVPVFELSQFATVTVICPPLILKLVFVEVPRSSEVFWKP